MASWRGACTAGRNRAQRRTLDAIHKRERHRQRWRDIAMGRNVQVRLFEVFGVTALASSESSPSRARGRQLAQSGASLG